MSLNEHLLRVPLWRSHSLPFSAVNLILFCYKRNIQHLHTIINDQNKSLIKGVLIFDDKDLAQVDVSLDSGEEVVYPTISFSELNNYIHCEFILFSKEFDYGTFLLGQNFLKDHGIESFYTLMPYSHNHGSRTAYIPTYYTANKKSLDYAYLMIQDDLSRDVFAARVRSLLTGNVGYLPFSRYPQYMHPLVKPEIGDIVIDGGVSEVIGEQLEMIKAVGENGRIYGFEPDKDGFAKASASLSKNENSANYTLVPFGLWDKRECVSFIPAKGGSRVADAQAHDFPTAEMISVDEFVKENHLSRVDFIKLDVEGSELRVLQGAVETIQKYQPRLAISVYHKFEDLFLLPKILKKINPNYTLYFGHHHPALFETIMYARID